MAGSNSPLMAFNVEILICGPAKNQSCMGLMQDGGRGQWPISHTGTRNHRIKRRTREEGYFVILQITINIVNKQCFPLIVKRVVTMLTTRSQFSVAKVHVHYSF